MSSVKYQGNQEGEDIIGKQRKTTNDCPGEIIECQIPLGCVRFSSVASDNIYHVLSVRVTIASQLCAEHSATTKVLPRMVTKISDLTASKFSGPQAVFLVAQSM